MYDKLIESIEMECPICNTHHLVEKRSRPTQALYKGEVVDYGEQYFICSKTDNEDNEFVSAKLMDENMLRIRDSYRKLRGLLTSGEIAGIRNVYGLTQSEFAALLGWGEVTVTRYESKTIQDETYDGLMKMLSNDPMLALSQLEKHKERFRLDRFVQIKEKISEVVQQVGNSYLKIQEINSKYLKYQKPSENNGYKNIDLDKTGKLMAYFASNVDNLFKVKMMKLLWYADTIHFLKKGVSITGLVYEHMTYGALPVGFNEIMSLPEIKVTEEMISEDIAYRILPNIQVAKENFTFSELEAIELVIKKFKKFRSSQIVEYMHLEKAYLDTRDHEIIRFDKSCGLREFK